MPDNRDPRDGRPMYSYDDRNPSSSNTYHQSYYDPMVNQSHPDYDRWNRPPQTRRRGGGAGAAVAVLLAFVLLCSLGVVLVVGLRGGQLSDRMENWGIRIEWPAITPAPTLPPVDRNTLPPSEEQPPLGGGDARMQIVEITPTPPPVHTGARRVLTTEEIAEKMIPSVVGVTSAADEDGYRSTGSGIIMTADGYVITNHHVVDALTDIMVVLYDGREFNARLVGKDRQSDIAVLKVNAHDLPAAEFGDSTALKIGQIAVAIGNPMGMELQSTVTQGIISAINRDVFIEDRTMNMLQTDASLNPGNSGGPLINQYGQVIGIISSKIMGDYITSVEGLGFAIPISSAAPLIDELIERGYIKGRPTIGITGMPLDERTARYYNLPEGLRVISISPDSDANRKGLRVDDIITHINGTRITTAGELNAIKNEFSVGDEITLTVHRNGSDIEITFALMDEGELAGR